jgi:hypothetical protein
MNKLKIIKIGLSFGDNDFSITFEAFLKNVGYGFGPLREETIEQVKNRLNNIYNLSILGMYIAVQNRLEYRSKDETMEEHAEHIKNYLVKDGNNSKLFYINEEVDQYLESCDGWDNGEFHYIEILFNDIGEVQEPKFYSI